MKALSNKQKYKPREHLLGNYLQDIKYNDLQLKMYFFNVHKKNIFTEQISSSAAPAPYACWFKCVHTRLSTNQVDITCFSIVIQ